MISSDLDRIAFRFFKLFAQYEYALKMLGYASANKRGEPELDWDGFSNKIGKWLLEQQDSKIVDARNYIFEQPPKRQIWVNGSVTWENVPNNERSAQILFSHLRRIRNNLYHGGKFNRSWIDPDRSYELISRALCLLEMLLAANQRIKEAVSGNAL